MSTKIINVKSANLDRYGQKYIMQFYSKRHSLFTATNILKQSKKVAMEKNLLNLVMVFS